MKERMRGGPFVPKSRLSLYPLRKHLRQARLLGRAVLLLLTGWILSDAGFGRAGNAAEIGTLPLEVMEQGSNHRTVVARDPQTGEVVSQYTELVSGGFRRDENGQWLRCDTEVELFQDGAIARKTQYQVIFSPGSDDPNGVFDVLMPDKQSRLRGQCVGIAYREKSTGRSVFVGEIREAPGVVVGKDEVFYEDCFEGIRADIRYRVTLSGLVQDVILREQLPNPADFNLNADDVVAEVWTECLEAPQAERQITERRTRGGKMETDSEISFGTMFLGEGRSFPLEQPNGGQRFGDSLPVYKEFETVQGMKFLIEKIPYPDLAEKLQTLPARPQAHAIPKDILEKALVKAITPDSAEAGKADLKQQHARKRTRPVSVAESGRKTDKTIGLKIRKKSEPKQLAGYVWDFDLLTGSYTNYIFQAGTTYHISGDVYLYGSTVLQGSSVIKYGGGWLLIAGGSLETQTSLNNPVFLTLDDEDTVGSRISSPEGGGGGIGLSGAAAPLNISGLHAKGNGISINDSTASRTNVISHSQFIVSGGISLSTYYSGSILHLRNVYFYDNYWPISVVSAPACVIGEHVTISKAYSLPSYDGTTWTFTNSIFLDFWGPDPLTIDGESNIVYGCCSSAAVNFETVGNGRAYLPAGSALRNAGSTGIDPALAQELRVRTTYPPLIFSNVTLTADLTLFPQAGRGQSTPDIGYYYDPLDYVFYNALATNIDIKIAPGTMVGTFGGSSDYGLGIGGGTRLTAIGTPTAPIKFVRYNVVQEVGSGNWSTTNVGNTLQVFNNQSPPGEVTLRFTEWRLPGEPGYHFGIQSTNTYFLAPKDSSFHGGGLISSGTSLYATNCLFEGTSFSPQTSTAGFGVLLQNDTFQNGSISFSGVSSNFVVSDTLFDGTDLTSTNGTVVHNYNAYVSGNNRLPLTGSNGANDVVLSASMSYTNGTFGRFYQTVTNLVNRGSTGATNVGLYHFTTHRSEGKESDSVVDIGYHYPATAPAADGLVGHWRLEEGTGTTAADSSGYGHTGILASGPTWTSGKVGSGALSFDGSNDYVSATESSALRLPGDMTLAFWFKHSGLSPSGYSLLVGKGDSGHRNYMVLQEVSNTRLYFQQWDEINSNFVLLSSVLSTGVWYHATITESGTAAKLYINGSLDVSGTRSITPPTSSDPVRFGYAGWNAYYAGVLDDVRIYNRALTAGEVAILAGTSAWDLDGDGLPDYLEDTNGNGVLDSGETSVMSASDQGFEVLITQPDERFNLP